MATSTTTQDLCSLIERSGLLAPDRLAPYRDRGDESPEELARELTRDRLLTGFQARLLLSGKSSGFFLTEKFKILDLLGQGGMGRVLLCEHLTLNRLVAVKLLQIADDSFPGAAERFLREARAAAAVDHPNVVRVFDVDRSGATPFMVMEYVDGTNLHQLVTLGGRLTVDRACEYVRQAALGLEAARAAGLVHRDVKPGNLLLNRAGVVKVLDLGLARFNDDTGRNANLTAKFDGQSVLGTVDFIAPEQTQDSSRVDIRADIYSLGHTFYYLLTGRLPFGEATTAQKLLWHQIRQPEPLSEVRPEVPEPVRAVLERMIAKEPADRFQTPAEVAEALRPLIAGPVPPPSDLEMPLTSPADYLLGVSPDPTPSMLAFPPNDPATSSPSALLTLPHLPPGQGRSSVPLGPESSPMSLDPLAPWSAGLPSPTPGPRALTPPPAARSPLPLP